MRTDIHLFINNKEIEFNKDPQILFNYRITDSTNPTAVKNSFSKSITVEGTANNNDIFSHIWNLESYYNGNGFNPIIKTPFTLFVNGDIYEKGYARLDRITKKNNNIEYTITLYGGLGQFFWNLTYMDGGERMKLSDLTYTINGESPNLDFTINKNAVWDAWQTIMGNPSAVYSESEVNRPNNYLFDSKWEIINFAPMYNGIPDNFDSNKVLINRKDIPSGRFQLSTDGYTYINNFFLGETSEDLTEWETRDLRSYLQRPVVNMKSVVEACCDPANNGGYKVELDSHFFNSENPYWSDAWMTLPMLSEMNLDGGETETISDCTLYTASRNRRELRYSRPTISKYTNLSFSIRPRFDIDAQRSDITNPKSNILHNTTKYESTGGITVQKGFVKSYNESNGVILQLFAMDANNTIVGQSKAYALAESKTRWDGESIAWGYSSNGAEIEYLIGNWKKDTNGKYYFADENGNFKAINFSLTNDIEFDHLVLSMRTPRSFYLDYRGLSSGNGQSATDTSVIYLYELDYKYSRNWRDENTIWRESYNGEDFLGRVRGDYNFEVLSFSVQATDYQGLISNSRVPKDKLLSTDKTPCDYLLSYCKLFGLYFFQDPTEEAEDKTKYPNGVIHIMDRNTFYERNNIVDISELIDYSKNLEITPQTAKTKYYSFELPVNDSDASNTYNATYHKTYGEQTINTNYDFDAGKTSLYDGTAFKGGVMVQEKDGNFNTTPDIPNYMDNGLTYSYFKMGADNTYETEEFEMPISKNTSVPINSEGLEYYDNFPKLQCHTEENSSADGSGVLLFYLMSKHTVGQMGEVDYWLTDDMNEMTIVNDGNPCWIMTLSENTYGGSKFCYKVNYMPYFSRNINYGDNITHTWDFSGSKETFIPNTYNTNEMGIYDKCWKNYIKDMYDINARKLTCYIKLLDRPTAEWMRRFYWFENSLWRLNAITDWNMSSYNTTKMEFIKVQDVQNYAMDRITKAGVMELILNQSSIGYVGGQITGYVYLQDGGSWWLSDNVYAVDDNGNRYYYPADEIVTPYRGSGTRTSFVINVPTNNKSSKLVWHIPLAKEVWEQYGTLVEGVFTQSANVAGSLRFNPRIYNIGSTGGALELSFASSNINSSSYALEYNTNQILSARIDLLTKKVYVTVAPNTGTASRAISVKIKATDLGGSALSDSATIVQAVTSLSLTPTTLELDYDYNINGNIQINTNLENYNIEINDK